MRCRRAKQQSGAGAAPPRGHESAVTARTALSGPPWTLAALAGGGLLGVAAGVNPLLACAGVAGLGYAVLTAADLRLGLCLFTVITFLDLLPAGLGPTTSITKVAGLVLGLAWLASRSYGRLAGRGLLDEQPIVVMLIVAFLAWATVSSAWAPSPGAALGAVERYALNAVLLLIAYGAIRKRADLAWVIGAFVCGAGIAVAYGIAMPPATGASTAVERLAGTTGDPDGLAQVLVAALPLAVALAAGRDWPPVLRALGAATAVLSVPGIVLSLSRGGLIALTVVLIVAPLLAGRWRAKLLLVVPLVVLASAGYLLANPSALQRITSSNGGTGRTDLWTVGLRIVADQPVQGVGAGNFANASIHYLLRPGRLVRSDLIATTPKVAHNTYLTVVAELGLVGALLFAALIGIALGCAWRAVRLFARHRDGPMEMLARAWMIAMAGLLTADAFLSAEFSKQLWLLLALGPALLAVARSSSGRTAASRQPVHAPRGRLASAVRGATRPDPSPIT
jgi:O-antigen ligase